MLVATLLEQCIQGLAKILEHAVLITN